MLAVVVAMGSGCAVAQQPQHTDNAAAQQQKQTVNIDLPFVNDQQVSGKWQSVDFVKRPELFTPGQRNSNGDFKFKVLVFRPNGKTSMPAWTWTKGVIIDHVDRVAMQYTIKQMDNAQYMFFEWKSGDYTIRRKKPWYYVLKKVQ